jgi:hypothetical protein
MSKTSNEALNRWRVEQGTQTNRQSEPRPPEPGVMQALRSYDVLIHTDDGCTTTVKVQAGHRAGAMRTALNVIERDWALVDIQQIYGIGLPIETSPLPIETKPMLRRGN